MTDETPPYGDVAELHNDLRVALEDSPSVSLAETSAVLFQLAVEYQIQAAVAQRDRMLEERIRGSQRDYRYSTEQPR